MADELNGTKLNLQALEAKDLAPSAGGGGEHGGALLFGTESLRVPKKHRFPSLEQMAQRS